MRGSNILRFEEAMTPEDVKKYDLQEVLQSPVNLDFRCIISSLPPHCRDVGVIDRAHFYLCTRGIIMLSTGAYGYVGHAKLSFRCRQALPGDLRLHFMPWNSIRVIRTKRYVFYDRKTIVSEKRSMMRFKQDVSRALRVYNTELYRPLSTKDEGYRVKAEKGIYISEDGMCYIMKRNQSNHYYFVRWLAYADFLTLLKKMTL